MHWSQELLTKLFELALCFKIYQTTIQLARKNLYNESDKKRHFVTHRVFQYKKKLLVCWNYYQTLNFLCIIFLLLTSVLKAIQRFSQLVHSLEIERTLKKWRAFQVNRVFKLMTYYFLFAEFSCTFSRMNYPHLFFQKSNDLIQILTYFTSFV